MTNIEYLLATGFAEFLVLLELLVFFLQVVEHLVDDVLKLLLLDLFFCALRNLGHKALTQLVILALAPLHLLDNKICDSI